ncbi:MAG: hypothetical protein LBU39_01075 [Desulfobulbaceae bacterium]|jgi:hypothetical protein|nr:hypothetical protein [Desulfobulbaceae bacterium]
MEWLFAGWSVYCAALGAVGTARYMRRRIEDAERRGRCEGWERHARLTTREKMARLQRAAELSARQARDERERVAARRRQAEDELARVREFMRSLPAPDAGRRALAGNASARGDAINRRYPKLGNNFERGKNEC